MKIRVLLADDHALFREALSLTLELDAGIEVVGLAVDGQTVLDHMEHTAVDVVCMDMRMAGIGGVEATRKILQRYPQTRVIGLSAQDDPVLVAEMLGVGARGYVLKMDSGRELGEAIRRVHRNESYVSSSLGVRATNDTLARSRAN